jgi:hypothetical protein
MNDKWTLEECSAGLTLDSGVEVWPEGGVYLRRREADGLDLTEIMDKNLRVVASFKTDHVVLTGFRK